MNEYLRRIDERDYLTEREHREFLDRLNKDLEQIELLKLELEVEKIKVKYVMKELKKQDGILKILKNKKVDIDYLSTCLYEDIEASVKEYNAYDSENNLTKNEIILLKEWLDE